MSYWTWSGHNGELPTLHVFDYGLINLWEDGLTVEDHWLDRDPPTLKPEVLADLKEWGGVWIPEGLQIQFPNNNEAGAMMWKLKYTSKSGSTSPDSKEDPDDDGIIHLRGSGLGEII